MELVRPFSYNTSIPPTPKHKSLRLHVTPATDIFEAKKTY